MAVRFLNRQTRQPRQNSRKPAGVSAIRRAGVKPLLLATLLFAWLIVGGAAINHAVKLFL